MSLIKKSRAGRSLAALFAAEAVSNTGTEMAAVALPWFVLVTSGSPGRMGAVMAAEFAGIALCGIPVGQAAARLGPKRTMIVSDLTRAVLIALIPLLHALDSLTFLMLMVIGFAVGAFFPAYSSSQWLGLSALVGGDEDHLSRAGGLFGAVNEAASFLGPALGGALVALLGPSPVLVIDAASFLVPVALTAAFVPGTPPGNTVSADSRGMLAGVRYLLRDGPLARRVLGVAVQGMAWTAMMATLPVLALTRFHSGPRLAGWFVAAYGAGSMLGGLVTARIKLPGDRVAVLSICGFAVSTWLLLLPLSRWLVLTGVAATGVTSGMFYARFFAGLTARTAPDITVKVMTAVNAALTAAGPVGFVLAGQLLQHAHSARPSLLLVATSATVGALIVITTFESAQ
ncbi:MFS transporter [Streptomyces sp. RKAG293]|uniref:MFS transporter n=1 Tax=Streptomyces sp. RKAG293 TaxID=2893403 RepID=UPI002034950F|nr:MFS transporter [Streptomyces sp. RKAG293]MCM2416568.1 MFS transporter [Streptomyces sp. RKAG293]